MSARVRRRLMGLDALARMLAPLWCSSRSPWPLLVRLQYGRGRFMGLDPLTRFCRSCGPFGKMGNLADARSRMLGRLVVPRGTTLQPSSVPGGMTETCQVQEGRRPGESVDPLPYYPSKCSWCFVKAFRLGRFEASCGSLSGWLSKTR